MMVSRWRTSMLLLGISVVAVLIGALRLATQPTEQPPASSLSSAPDGALALYTWLGDLGGSTRRLPGRALDASVGELIVLQPTVLPDANARAALNGLADRGGTLIVAGDSLQWLVTARDLGMTVDPAPPSQHTLTTDGQSLPFSVRFRLQSPNGRAEPLLLSEDQQWLALRTPYRQGTLIVIASSVPLSNAGLRDDATARFVFRSIASSSPGQTIAFDEYQRMPLSPTPESPSLTQLLLHTAPGLAIVYAALLTFAFLFLMGRRFGPAVVSHSAAESQRSMYEHVQMLANLYRQAGQLDVVRESFSRHYRRVASSRGEGRRGVEIAEALARIESAHTESELVSAVAAIHDAD
jgi:uncharacterized protein DUF4350